MVELEGTTLLPEVLSVDLLEEVDLLELLRVDLEPLELLGATNKSDLFSGNLARASWLMLGGLVRFRFGLRVES